MGCTAQPQGQCRHCIHDSSSPAAVIIITFIISSSKQALAVTTGHAAAEQQHRVHEVTFSSLQMQMPAWALLVPSMNPLFPRIHMLSLHHTSLEEQLSDVLLLWIMSAGLPH
jgi:hypothetical protein